MKPEFLPISLSMNSIKSVTELYKIHNKLEGPAEAKRLIEVIISNSISDIVDEGLELTSEELDKRIVDLVNDFLVVAKNTNVA